MPARMSITDRDLILSLQALPQSLRRKAMVPAMRRYVRLARREARRTNLGFVDRSGRLRRSIRADRIVKGGTRKRPYISGTLSSSVPYAGVVEFGRSGRSKDTSYLREAFDRTEPAGYRIFDKHVARWLQNPI